MNPKVRAKKDDIVIGTYFDEEGRRIVIGGPLRWQEEVKKLAYRVAGPRDSRGHARQGLSVFEVTQDWKMSRSRVEIFGASEDTWQALLRRLEDERWTVTHVRTFRRLLG